MRDTSSDILWKLPEGLGEKVARIFVDQLLCIRPRPGRRSRVPQPMFEAFDQEYPVSAERALTKFRAARPALLAVGIIPPFEASVVIPRAYKRIVAEDGLLFDEAVHVFDGSLSWCIMGHYCVDMLVKFKPRRLNPDISLPDPEFSEEQVRAVMDEVAAFVDGHSG